MAKIRIALALASLEQYVGLAIGFAQIAALSRLLSPAEIGMAAVATGISVVVFSLREFATAEFLIQRTSVDEHDTRTAFTISFLVSVFLAFSLGLAAPTLAEFYGHKELRLFLILITVALVVEAVSYPIVSLLRRDMAFGKLALIRSASALVTATASIGLAVFDFGFMSIAMGGLLGSCVTASLAIGFRPAGAILRPSLASWRPLFEFGRYRGAATAIDRIYESLPQLILGRVLPMHSVGLYNRANAVCGIPDKILLSSVFAVAYPALAEALRQGQDIKAAYLRALAYITVLYWPALILLAILADPVVHIVLGPNWAAAIPLVQLLSLAAVFWFPAILTYPVLAAVGANRDTFLSNLIGRSFAAASLSSASMFGLTAMALSQFVNLPFQMFVSLIFVRRHVHFTWRELGSALAPSLLVALSSMAGPAVLIIARGFRFDHSMGIAALIVVLAGTGWLLGMVLVRHQMLAELGRLRNAAFAALAGIRKARGRAALAGSAPPGGM